MKLTYFLKLASYGIRTIFLKNKNPIVGTIIVTDKCNLSCKHCAVNNLTSEIYPYLKIENEMLALFKQGVKILFLCGGETFLWQDNEKTLRDLVINAKKIGFFIVNVVTNGTYSLDLPEADLILLSLDGEKENHDYIRGETFDLIMDNIRKSKSSNICLYMAINTINKNDIEKVSKISFEEKNIRAISFNFHTPYPKTEYLSLSKDEKKQCCDTIEKLISSGFPVFNLKNAFPYIINNNFPTPCYQCLVMENGKQTTCGRCIDIENLCSKCGYFFAAEYALLFNGNIKIIFEMLKTYLKYI